MGRRLGNWVTSQVHARRAECLLTYMQAIVKAKPTDQTTSTTVAPEKIEKLKAF
jgi:hypothetical protein